MAAETRTPWAMGEEAAYPRGLTERCELLERLSGDSRGETLLVRERESGRLLIAKCRNKEGAPPEDGEADILGRLRGPGVPALVDVCENETTRCLLREYIPGETLDKAARSGMTEEQARQIGLGLCRVLRYLHSQDPPVIHRDIKPQNVVLTEDGKVYLIDFDISRRYSRDAPADTVISGTQDFAAPEQYGFSQTDWRSYIFSLEVLLYWLVTGRTKVGDASAGSLDHCVRRCTAFDPKRRYHSVEAVERALRAAGPRGRRLTRAAAVLLAALVLAAGCFLLSGVGAEEEPPQDVLADLPPAETGISPAETDAAPEDPAEPVAFQDPLIESAVRLVLGKGPEEAIMAEELAAVEGIFVVLGDVYSDMGQYWAYGSAPVPTEQDLAEVGGGVRTLEDLRMLPNLRELGISGGSVTDLSPLAELTKLESVDLRYNQVRSVEPLAGLPSMALLGLNRNPVEDLSPLADCPALRILDLCGVPGLTGEDLRGLTGPYQRLDLSEAASCGGALTGWEIRELLVSVDGDPTLSVLEGVRGLERLELRGTGEVDLTALADHPALWELSLTSGVTAADLTPLLSLPGLETVSLPASMAPAAQALGETPFQIEIF